MQSIRRLITILLLSVLGATAFAQPTASSVRIHLPFIVRASNPNNLEVSSATYLGGSAADSATALAIASDGKLVLGGLFPGYAPAGITPTVLNGATSAAILRLSADGRQALTLTRIGGTITDLDLADDDRITVCGDFGVAFLDAQASSTLWSAAIGATTRCAVAGDGTVAALVGKQVVIYSATGAQINTLTISDNPLDLAIDATRSQVIVIGWRQITANLQMPFIRAFGLNGTKQWTAYDYPAGTANIGSADTRGERITLGRDGKLYAAFSINGGTGVSVLARDPLDPTISAANRTVVTDEYTNPFNIGSVSMAWFGRFNPSTGALEQGQSLLTRLSSTKGNSISIKAIAADAQGRVALAGDTACCISNRDTRQVAFTTVGAYELGEAYALTVSADFQTRTGWTVFTAPGGSAGGSPATAIALRNGHAALAATLNPKSGLARGLITFQAIQPTLASSSASDAYLATWLVP